MQNPLEALELLGDLVTRRGFENAVVPTSLWTGGCGCPPDTHIWMGSNPFWHRSKKRPSLLATASFYLVTRRGFEPRTHCLKGSCSANWASGSDLAGMAGFEPTNARVKVWCLTAWRHPNILTGHTLYYNIKLFNLQSFFEEKFRPGDLL